MFPLRGVLLTVGFFAVTSSVTFSATNASSAKLADQEVSPTEAGSTLKAISVGTTVHVALDGTEDFRSIQSAIDALARSSEQAAVVRVRPGIYREKLRVPAMSPKLTIVGDDQISTVISWNDCADTLRQDGTKVGTSGSASVTIEANDCALENLTIQNAHGAGSQAVALRVKADRFMARSCRILGWQDTLLAEQGRHFFENCLIEGHVDFVFGAATAWFESCRINVLGSGFIAAPSTAASAPYGLIFANCRITADSGIQTYLARPWRDHGSVTYLHCALPAAVRPEGWHNWNEPAREATARFAEFASLGPGSNPNGRVAWSHQLSAEERDKITLSKVLGVDDAWAPSTVPRLHTPGTQISDDLSSAKLQSLPERDRAPWIAYLEQSRALMARDKDTLQNEMREAGLTKSLPPPSSGDNQLNLKQPDEWYGSPDAIALAEAVISFQVPSGGWSKAVSYKEGRRQPAMHWSSQASEALWHYVGTIDNGATIQQLRFLAKVYGATRRQELLDSWRRGFEYLLQAQYPNGGWPQVFPLEGGYHDAITFNDDAMLHVLELLQEVAKGSFDFMTSDERERAHAALLKGVDCLLVSQVRQGGKLTVWCAQHDPVTLVPVAARLKEPASLTGGESVGLVRFLMKMPQRSASVQRSIDTAVDWFREFRITGLRETSRDGRSFWQVDPEVDTPVWARFYDIHTNRPIFAGAQDGIIYDDFETMWRNNRFGYDYYLGKGKDLLGGVGQKTSLPKQNQGNDQK